MKTSYFVCNPSRGTSIIRKQTINEGSVVKDPKQKMKVENVLEEDEVECETNFLTNAREIQKEIDEHGIVAVDTYPENMELVVVVTK